MKRRVINVCILFILLFSLVLQGCSGKVNNTNEVSNLDFVNIQSAREELKTVIWGSQGWITYFQDQSNYIYAGHGSHLLRYNIKDNKIDRAIKLHESFGGIHDTNLRFTLDGEYAIIGISNQDQKGLTNINFLNFENKTNTFLANEENNFKIEDVPEEVRSKFNTENIFHKNNDNHDVLKFKIVYNSEESTYFVHTLDNASSSYELNTLRGAYFNAEPHFVGIDDKTIGTLLPTDDDGLNLGYYKFVLIDIEKDEIIQEYAINRR
ncbi:hypothetical protein RH915_02590 [Serpentinicella sp. ANB-PHB4]|uniref:hypothetical protein n=1 Tax=Serpentinicella sp. ANB-PHB4 TaxID=3074076 RepID=UPI0028590291|nr:hypothetical protein [Serpentinicella sp. ANB-PHB4]MDR5658369.1 hypothetical protein [Serpentinicella sp. ANB-PHB4]